MCQSSAGPPLRSHAVLASRPCGAHHRGGPAGAFGRPSTRSVNVIGVILKSECHICMFIRQAGVWVRHHMIKLGHTRLDQGAQLACDLSPIICLLISMLRFRSGDFSEPRHGWAPDPPMVGIRSPIGLVVGSCTSHPGVFGSIPKREEPGKTGAPCVKVPGSSRVPVCKRLLPLRAPLAPILRQVRRTAQPAQS